jgi:hypothetical protein
MGIDRSSGQPDEEPDRPREEPRPVEPADYRESVQAQPETRSRQEYYDVLASGRGYEIVGFAALMAERPASERHEWQTPLSQGEVDRCGLGVIDERAKRFSAAERRIAEHLADAGPAVISVSEGFGIYGRTADARVNGISGPAPWRSMSASTTSTTTTSPGQAVQTCRSAACTPP